MSSRTRTPGPDSTALSSASRSSYMAANASRSLRACGVPLAPRRRISSSRARVWSRCKTDVRFGKVRAVPKVSPERLEATRRRVLDGARRAFAAYGYEGATVRRLEEETGLSRGAIFHHFPTRTRCSSPSPRRTPRRWRRSWTTGLVAGDARAARQGRRLARRTARGLPPAAHRSAVRCALAAPPSFHHPRHPGPARPAARRRLRPRRRADRDPRRVLAAGLRRPGRPARDRHARTTPRRGARPRRASRTQPAPSRNPETGATSCQRSRPQQLRRPRHPRGRRPVVRDLPARRGRGRGAAAVQPQGAAGEPAAHRGRRTTSPPTRSGRSPAGTRRPSPTPRSSSPRPA